MQHTALHPDHVQRWGVVTGSLGERVAAYRRRRGMSQAVLAGLVGRSESWLSQVERGVRSVDRMSTMLDLARVLKIDVQALIGRPWEFAPNGGEVVDELAPLRTHFARYEHLVNADQDRQPVLAPLRASVAAAHQRYQAADYRATIQLLPALLSGVDTVRPAHQSTGAARELALTYVSAYVVAAKLLTKLGATDMAMVASDRAAAAAVDADSLSGRAMAAYQVACALLRADRTDDAEHLAMAMAEQASSHASSESPELLSLAGALWLISAVISARRTEKFQAWTRLDEAQRLAGVLGYDGNHAWTGFGPTNVAIHRVTVAAELGDAGAALRAAAGIDVRDLPEGLTSRRAQMHLDLAWAQSQRKRDAEAVLSLLEAERVAPEAVRYSVVVRELIREMLARQSRGRTSALHDLAVRAGVLE